MHLPEELLLSMRNNESFCTQVPSNYCDHAVVMQLQMLSAFHLVLSPMLHVLFLQSGQNVRLRFV